VKEGEGGKEPPEDPAPVQIRLFERNRSHYSWRLPANPVHTYIHICVRIHMSHDIYIHTNK